MTKKIGYFLIILLGIGIALSFCGDLSAEEVKSKPDLTFSQAEEISEKGSAEWYTDNGDWFLEQGEKCDGDIELAQLCYGAANAYYARAIIEQRKEKKGKNLQHCLDSYCIK